MKKLNESVLRKLIMETLDDQYLNEGKKKKRLKEVDPVPTASEAPPESFNKAHARTAAGIAQTTGQTDEVPDVDVAMALDAKLIEKNLKDIQAIAKSENPLVASGAKDMLKNYIKELEKAVLPGQQEE